MYDFKIQFSYYQPVIIKSVLNMEKRKDYVTTFGELKINHVWNHLKVEFGRQVPTGAILIGRIRYLIKNGQTMKVA